MSDEFVIRWEVDEISKLTNVYRYSPYEYHFGIPWRFIVGTEKSNRTKSINYFSLYLQCNNESVCDVWSCERKTTFSLIHWTDPEKSKHREVDERIHKAISDWGYCGFMEFTTLLNNTGFVKGDKIVVEARTKVTSLKCIRKIVKFNFSQPTADWDNIALKLEDGTVFVCRTILMWHSPYFSSLFLEKNQDQFEMTDVRVKEFTELLQIIFPSQIQLNEETYTSVLSLADRFQIEFVLDKVEQFLINTNQVKPAKKMLLAEQYRLESLTKHCIDSLKTLKDIKNLETYSEFAMLSTSSKALLFKKALELIKTNIDAPKLT